MELLSTVAVPKLSFPGPIRKKSSRMRSGGKVPTISNSADAPALLAPYDEDGVNYEAGAKKKEVTTIPIFLKKTYDLIDNCDPSIASWTEDGEMFVIKDRDALAAFVIPRYFDHNKFSSFARQLSFYGFRKIPSTPIRNCDKYGGTAKHVTYANEYFKRGRCDLLKKIQRSTCGGGNISNGQNHQHEVQHLREQVHDLQKKLQQATKEFEERIGGLEHEMFAMQQRQQHMHLQLQTAASVGANSSLDDSAPNTAGSFASSLHTDPTCWRQEWETKVRPFMQGSSLQSQIESVDSGKEINFDGVPQHPQPVALEAVVEPPSLLPHPKEKHLPIPNTFPLNSVGVPNSTSMLLQGISTQSREFSLNRGASIESSASAVLRCTSWDFSMPVLGEVDPDTFNLACAQPAVNQNSFISGISQHKCEMSPPQDSDQFLLD